MRKLLSVMLAIMLLMTSVAAFAEESAGTPTDTELTFVVSDEIQGTDMQMISWVNMVHRLLYAPLVIMDESNTNPVPNVVSEISIENDGKDFVFTIPEGICFSNGDPVTAEAVVANFERYRETSVYASDLDPVTSIEADGDKVIFRCDKAAPFLWAVLASEYSGLVDVAAIPEGGDDAFNQKAVTYGPYTVEEWQQGQQIVLVRNENFKSYSPYVSNKGAAYPSKITIRFISDDYTRVNELLSGSVDYICAVPAANLGELQANPDIVVAETYQAGCDYLLLNTEDEVLSDYNVRLAISKAINREELCAAQNDTIIPADGYLSPSQVGYSEESAAKLKELYGFDLEGAKQLLADAGWTDSDGDGIVEKDGKKLSFEVLIPNDYTALKNAAPVLQYQLKNAGIEMTISELEGAAIKAQALDGNYQVAGRKYSWADADMLYNLFGSEGGYYSNETIDNLLLDARYIVDGTERAAKYAEAQEELFNQMPGIPLFYEIEYNAYRNGLEGVNYTSTGSFVIQDVYMAN